MQDRIKIIEQTVVGLGYDLVDIENTQQVLRIYIDTISSDKNISIDDCVKVSNQLTRIFEVESVDYDRLEVSTPGIDRPLKTYAHYLKFIGHEAVVTFKQPLGNKKKYAGVIIEPKNENTLCLEVENKKEIFVIDFTINEVDKAKLSLEAYFPKSSKAKTDRTESKPKKKNDGDI